MTHHHKPLEFQHEPSSTWADVRCSFGVVSMMGFAVIAKQRVFKSSVESRRKEVKKPTGEHGT